MSKSLWRDYACVLPPASGNRTFELKTLYHVTHASTAVRIVEDGQIAKGLVYDESRLNVTRRQVVWLSPNTWHAGSRYGTVQFEFDWSTLVTGKRLYWVEAMTSYSPPAVRLFITDGRVDDLPGLTDYDPAAGDGPLVRHGENWLWNGQYTAEIMLDSDLSLSDCIGVDFVSHHPTFCNIGHARCTERGKDGWDAAARLMAFILTSGKTSADDALVRKGQLASPADHAMGHIALKLGVLGSRRAGPIKRKDQAISVVHGALAELSLGRPNEANSLAALIESPQLIYSCLQTMCTDHFGVGSTWLSDALE